MIQIKRITVFILFFSCFCTGNRENQQTIEHNSALSSIPRVQPKIIRIISHDSAAFTQGLLFHDGYLLESDGLYDKSTIRRLDTNGTVLKTVPVKTVFAEGCALMDGRLYQLTWREQTGFVYSIPSLEPEGSFTYEGQGWGLTSNKTDFIMSNGSDTLYFRNSRFEITKRLPVRIDGKQLTNINEIEYVKGDIFANVWYSDYIFEISPQTGDVIRIVDCGNIVSYEKPVSESSVLNGIAYDSTGNVFYITGKDWKHMFKVSIPGI